MTAYSDSDWAGDKVTRKLTSSGVVCHGMHVRESYSVNQQEIALSSGESEFYAAGKMIAHLLFLVYLLVEINHGNGISTRYGHAKTVDVKVGDIVRTGDVIAKMGSSGRSTGPHVHYEVLKNGRQVNPHPYIYRARR